MREILFRGQTRKKGEKVRLDGSPVDSNWVYGGVLQGEGDFSIIYQTEPKIEKFSVYSDTLGQYTGLLDKNGTKIFEGDILKTNKFSEPNKQYIVKFDLQFGAFIGEDNFNIYFITFDGDSDQFEVIGNIYDNPELLKQEG